MLPNEIKKREYALIANQIFELRLERKGAFMAKWTLAIILILLSAVALASITGTISGIVTDPGGAVVTGASVKAINVQTGVEQTITTDAKGFYSFPALAIGTYTIDVQHPGFKDFEQKNIVIDANSVIRADAKLQVGAVQQQVNGLT